MWPEEEYSRGENAAVLVATVLFCCREHKAALYWGSDGTIFSPSLPQPSLTQPNRGQVNPEAVS